MHELYASPLIEEDGHLHVVIHDASDDSIVDCLCIGVDEDKAYESEHDIPMRVMSSVFVNPSRYNAAACGAGIGNSGKLSREGHRYRITSTWDYPFHGDRIGCQVVRVE